MRDPRDIVVSMWYYHCRKNLPFIKQYMDSKDPRTGMACCLDNAIDVSHFTRDGTGQLSYKAIRFREAYKSCNAFADLHDSKAQEWVLDTLHQVRLFI